MPAIVTLRTLGPSATDAWTRLASARDTGRLLVVEEGQGFVALGSEILAQVAESKESSRQIDCARLSAYPRPIPAARPLEEQYLPSAKDIVAEALELLGGQ